MAGVFSKVLVYFGLEERSFTQNTPNTTSKDAKFYTRKCVKTGNSILITQDANGRIRIFEFLENSENGFQNHEQCPTCKEYIYETKKSEDVPKRYSEADAKASEDVQIGDVKDSGKEDVQKSDDVQDSEKRTEDVRSSDDVDDSEDVKDAKKTVKLQNPEKPHMKKCLLCGDVSESDFSESELSESDISDSENIEFLMGIQKSRLTGETEVKKQLIRKICESANRGNWYGDVKEDSEDLENPEWASEEEKAVVDASREDVKYSEEDVADSEDEWESEDDTQWEDSDSEDVTKDSEGEVGASGVSVKDPEGVEAPGVRVLVLKNDKDSDSWAREAEFIRKLNDVRRKSMIEQTGNLGAFAYSEDVKKSQGVEDAEEDVEASEGDMYSPGENVETLGDVEDLEEGVKNSGEGVEDLEHEWGSEDYTQWEESDSEDFNDSDPWTASLQESMRKLKNPKTDSEDVNAAKNTSEVVRKFRNLMNEIHEENQRRNEELLKIFK
ncbi:Protein CBG26623 [Caenorhabditis briggsae]|uniref:Protein CBG26623 n=1 Tax=Caenorhabditis briggsae TaxID=6238 RepID=B6ILJ3_CAEBR|nr:Protein CBG26623 [Caenorhabditis briggsae]CAS00773.1 Protein CBG26623 [Caenorhabditis briggsae]